MQKFSKKLPDVYQPIKVKRDCAENCKSRFFYFLTNDDQGVYIKCEKCNGVRFFNYQEEWEPTEK